MNAPFTSVVGRGEYHLLWCTVFSAAIPMLPGIAVLNAFQAESNTWLRVLSGPSYNALFNTEVTESIENDSTTGEPIRAALHPNHNILTSHPDYRRRLIRRQTSEPT